jgi:hypothetical protein
MIIKNQGLARERFPSSELATELEMAQKTREDVLQQQQRGRLLRERWRQAGPVPTPTANELFVRCPHCGNTLEHSVV